MDGDILDRLIRELHHARQEYWQLKFGRPSADQLGPPASNEEIAETERLLGRPLPPSYRFFLSVHKRWSNFVGDALILSPLDRQSELIQTQIAGFKGIGKDENNASVMTGFVVVAGESSHYLAYLETAQVAPDGEMEVIEWSYHEGEMARHPDFVAYLKARLDTYRELIAKEKGK